MLVVKREFFGIEHGPEDLLERGGPIFCCLQVVLDAVALVFVGLAAEAGLINAVDDDLIGELFRNPARKMPTAIPDLLLHAAIVEMEQLRQGDIATTLASASGDAFAAPEEFEEIGFH